METTITLSKQKALFTDKEHYLNFLKAWKETCNSEAKNTLKPEHFLLYAAFRGQDWRKGFSPCTNKNKLANGYAPYYSAFTALQSIHTATKTTSMWRAGMLMEPFKETITKEMLIAIGNMIPELKSVIIDRKLISGDKLPEVPYTEVL